MAEDVVEKWEMDKGFFCFLDRERESKAVSVGVEVEVVLELELLWGVRSNCSAELSG